jgi:hypothetical protein
MTTPPTMVRPVNDCTWATPEALPTYDPAARSLEPHNPAAHYEDPNTPQEVTSLPGNLTRPELGEDCTESDWNHFQVKWQRYRRSTLTNASIQHITNQLWACCSALLEETIWRTGTAGSYTTEGNLLKTMEQMAVSGRSTLPNTTKHFSARPRDQTSIHDPRTPDDYTDKTVPAHNATKEDMDRTKTLQSRSTNLPQAPGRSANY